jgi:hypothetical protein
MATMWNLFARDKRLQYTHPEERCDGVACHRARLRLHRLLIAVKTALAEPLHGWRAHDILLCLSPPVSLLQFSATPVGYANTLENDVCLLKRKSLRLLKPKLHQN